MIFNSFKLSKLQRQLKGIKDPIQNEIPIICNKTNAWVIKPFFNECPTVTKDKKIKAKPKSCIILKKNLLDLIDNNINVKPEKLNNIDFANRLSIEIIIKSISNIPITLPDKLAGMEIKNIKDIKIPKIENLFNVLLQNFFCSKERLW